MRKLADAFEIVGVVEPDPAWLKQHGGLQCYEGLKWMSADELLATPGLDAVAVETDGFDLIPTAQRCAERTDYAGRNYHIDPHPRFVGNDRYVVFTTTVRGEIDVALVPTTALLQATA